MCSIRGYLEHLDTVLETHFATSKKNVNTIKESNF